MRLDLVDRFHLLVHPVASPGAEWLGGIDDRRDFELVSSAAYSNGVVGLYFEPPPPDRRATKSGRRGGTARVLRTLWRVPDVRVSPEERARLRRWNLGLAALHGAQAVAILLLANDFSIPVTVSYLSGPPGADALSDPYTLFDLPFSWAIAAFLALAALDHLIVALDGGRRFYERNLERGQSPIRWYEYSLSASIMIILIAMLTGIEDAAALIAIFGANVGMILFGLVSERVNAPGDPPDWRPFAYGSILGAVPWIAIALQIAVGSAEGGDVPGFVIAIFISLGILFFSFAVNMALQLARVGPWRDYLFSERGYLVLSLVAKSALAWQIFGSTLAA